MCGIKTTIVEMVDTKNRWKPFRFDLRAFRRQHGLHDILMYPSSVLDIGESCGSMLAAFSYICLAL